MLAGKEIVVADYDHPSLVESNRWLAGSVEEEHERAKVGFLKMQPAQRIEAMRAWQYAIAEDGRATRGTAQLWTQLRELERIHFSLLKVNR
jgi:hypothetical protein